MPPASHLSTVCRVTVGAAAAPMDMFSLFAQKQTHLKPKKESKLDY